jgi:hypothetical protein
MGHQGFSESNIYYCAGSGSADSHPKAEPQEQRVSPYILLQAGFLPFFIPLHPYYYNNSGNL